MATLLDQLQDVSDQKRSIIDALKTGAAADIEEILSNLTDLLEEYIAEKREFSTAELASLNQLEDLVELLDAAGLDKLEARLRSGMDEISDKLAAQLEVTGLSAGQVTLDETALEAYVNFKVRDVADTISSDVTRQVQRAWIESTFSGKPLRQAISEATADAVQLLTTQTPAQVQSVVGTAVSSVDRAITGNVGARDDSIVYIYIGPRDVVVRDSCKHIVGKYATTEQIAQLDNRQLANVAVTGGGYNCRHSWAPVKRAVADKRGVAQVTDAEIKAFNTAQK